MCMWCIHFTCVHTRGLMPRVFFAFTHAANTRVPFIIGYMSICLYLIATGLMATILRSIFAVYAPLTSTFSISRVAGNVIVQGSNLILPIPASKAFSGFVMNI